MGLGNFLKDLLPDGFIPDECTPFKYNPLSMQLELFIKLSKGKLNIHDRASCKSRGAQILKDIVPFTSVDKMEHFIIKCGMVNGMRLTFDCILNYSLKSY